MVVDSENEDDLSASRMQDTLLLHVQLFYCFSSFQFLANCVVEVLKMYF